AETGQQARESLSRARTWIGENKLAAARQELAEARGRIGTDRAAHPDLVEKIEALEAELGRFQQFLDRIDRAHQAETGSPLEPRLAAADSRGRAGAPAPARRGGRRPAAAVPFLLEALQRYGVLEHDD